MPDSSVSVIEAHEELAQHIEAGRRKIRLLSVVTIVVASFFILSYLNQLILPLVTGSRYVTIDLLDPTLIVTQLVVMALMSAWLIVGVTEYRFASRLGRAAKEARAREREIEKRISGQP